MSAVGWIILLLLIVPLGVGFWYLLKERYATAKRCGEEISLHGWWQALSWYDLLSVIELGVFAWALKFDWWLVVIMALWPLIMPYKWRPLSEQKHFVRNTLLIVALFIGFVVVFGR